MPSGMVPPIIVDNEPDGLSFYRSIEALERHLEPWYPREETFTAYDAEGRHVTLVVEEREVPAWWGRRTRRMEIVTARLAEDEPLHAAELREALAARLADTGLSTEWLDSATLRELLNRAMTDSNADVVG